jgi:hypothetical protein
MTLVEFQKNKLPNVRHLRSNAWQLHKSLHCIRNVAVVFVDEYLRCIFDVLCFVAIESNRNDKLFKLCLVDFRKFLGRESVKL